MNSARMFVKRLQKSSSNDGVFIVSRYSGRSFLASPEDVSKICEEFKQIKDKYGIFEQFFIHMFLDSDIGLARYFKLDNMDEEALKKEQSFRTHVGKFQRFLTSIIDMLSRGSENTEQLVQVLRAVGRQHGHARSMSFTAEKWLLFKNVLLSLISDENSKHYGTWNKLMSFIIFEIKDSYLEHVRHARSSSCPAVEQLRVFRRSQYRKTSDLSGKNVPK